MKLTKIKTLLLLFVILPVTLFSQNMKEEAVNRANDISFDEFFSYMSFFAHDSMGGRDVASAGYNYSAEFVESKLKEFNIEPAGDNNSYFQSVPMIHASITPGSSSIYYQGSDEKIEFSFGENITLLPSTSHSEMDMSAKLVFAGNGIVIPERRINPYEGVDVKGKIVVLQMSTPKSYRSDSVSRANSQIDKRMEAAVKAGAMGVIIYFPMKALEKMVFNAVHKEIANSLYTLDAENTQSHFFDFGLDFLAFSKMEFLDKILVQQSRSLKQVSKDIKNGIFQPFEIEGDFSFKYNTTITNKTCKNVAGILKGSDPELKDEYIVVSAHLDHIGIGKALKGDSIYNGAWDNASGSAGVLSLAHSFANLSSSPKRSILFLWYTGEEKGLLGSNYFITYPTVEKEKIKANVNLDMVGNLFDAKDFIAMGYDYSTISEAIDFAGGNVGMERDTDNTTQNRYFSHSDHYSFVRAGIPAVMLWGGMTPVGKDKKNAKVYEKWEKKHLHKPDDDLNQDFSTEALLKGVKLNFLTAWYLANEMDDIDWKTDNMYYKKYVLTEE